MHAALAERVHGGVTVQRRRGPRNLLRRIRRIGKSKSGKFRTTFSKRPASLVNQWAGGSKTPPAMYRRPVTYYNRLLRAWLASLFVIV